jgi:hypothetical protein
MSDAASSPNAIELRLRDPSQMFNTLDPLPFRERDLAPDAAEYIVDWAEELPADRPIAIVVHLPSDQTAEGGSSDLGDAVRAYFAGRAKAEGMAIRTLFRDGRRAFLIGIALILAVVTLAWQLTLSFEGAVSQVLQESLVIIGWVIIWRPAEMFLYDWVPLARQQKLFRRLAASTVAVRHDQPPSGKTA